MSTDTSMSKREYFAARAMQGLICVGQGRWPLRDDCLELAKRSVMCADALLVELAKEPTSEPWCNEHSASHAYGSPACDLQRDRERRT